MKTCFTAIVFSVCILVTTRMGFGQLPVYQSGEQPGDLIVYSDGHDLIGYDLATKDLKNLTHLPKGIDVNGAFAVTPDARHAVFTSRGKVLAMELPYGKPFNIKLYTNTTGGRGNRVEHHTDLRAIENNELAISPDGEKFAYDLPGVGDATFISRIDPLINTCKGVTVLDTFYVNYVDPMIVDSQFNQRTGGANKAGMCQSMMFGNTDPEYGIFPSYVAATRAFGPGSTAGGDRTWWWMNPIYRPGELNFTWEEFHARFSMRHDAYFPSFAQSKIWRDRQLIALIYKSQQGFGPIELYDLNAELLWETADPGLYTIALPRLLAECSGLSWTPDGSLMFLTAGSVWLVDHQEIKDLINNSNSRIVNDASPDIPGTSRKVAVNNTLQAVPKPLYSSPNIAGNLIATGEDEFFCLGADNFVWHARQGVDPTKHCKISGRQFFYCQSKEESKPKYRIYRPLYVAKGVAGYSMQHCILSSAAPWKKLRADNGLVNSFPIPIEINSIVAQIKPNPKRKEGGFVLNVDWDPAKKFLADRYSNISYALLKGGTIRSVIANPENIKEDYQEITLPLQTVVKEDEFVIFKIGGVFIAVKPSSFIDKKNKTVVMDYYYAWLDSPELREQYAKDARQAPIRTAELPKSTKKKK